LAARFPTLRGASGSGLRGGCPLLERFCALRTALWGGEPTRRRLSRRVDGGWSGAAGRCSAGHSCYGPGLQGLDGSRHAIEQLWVLSKLNQHPGTAEPGYATFFSAARFCCAFFSCVLSSTF